MPDRLGRLIVVGGHTRGVGKTALVEHLLRTWTGGFVAAVKISAHRHAAKGTIAPVFEEALTPSGSSQTGRFVIAGADRAWLCRCPADGLEQAAAFVMARCDSGCDVIVESNRIVRYLRPDLVLFVVSGLANDWKASSGPCLRRADALVLSPGTTTIPSRARAPANQLATRRLPAFRFTASWTVPGLERWLGDFFEDVPRPQSAPSTGASPGAAPALP